MEMGLLSFVIPSQHLSPLNPLPALHLAAKGCSGEAAGGAGAAGGSTWGWHMSGGQSCAVGQTWGALAEPREDRCQDLPGRAGVYGALCLPSLSSFCQCNQHQIHTNCE